MHVKSLKLKDFRSYKDLKICFENGYNIIYGNNAQGKTNIIEAIYICATGRSHRTSRDTDLVRNESEGYYIGLEIEKDKIPELIEIKNRKDEKKQIKINSIPLKKIGGLMGHINAVIFSPEDLFIIKEGPSERRRFLDMTISQMKPSYFYDLQQYGKILFQRNSLLKEINEKKELETTLDVWNRHLVITGSRIISKRKEFMKVLNKTASKRHSKLTNGEENLYLGYMPSFRIDTDDGVEEIEIKFEKALNSLKVKELMKCTTLLGPQRDDYEILINGMNTKMFCSQGQQRTAVLSMKLAEIDVVRQDINDCPILLLDDVLSELDDRRQEYLFESVGEMQTFITCTDKGFYYNNTRGSRYFLVQNSEVSPG